MFYLATADKQDADDPKPSESDRHKMQQVIAALSHRSQKSEKDFVWLRFLCLGLMPKNLENDTLLCCISKFFEL